MLNGLKVFFSVCLLLCLSGCPEDIVGSPDDSEIRNVSFTIDNTFVDGQSLVAQGRARYNGRSSISPPWYVEGQFYTSSSFTTKLGGDNTRLSVPLSQGQETFFTLRLSSSEVDLRQFPNFRVGDLRAIYKN